MLQSKTMHGNHAHHALSTRARDTTAGAHLHFPLEFLSLHKERKDTAEIICMHNSTFSLMPHILSDLLPRAFFKAFR